METTARVRSRLASRLAARLCACAVAVGGVALEGVALAEPNQAPPPERAPLPAGEQGQAAEPGRPGEAPPLSRPLDTPPPSSPWFEHRAPSLHFRIGKAGRVAEDVPDSGFSFDATVGMPAGFHYLTSGLWPELGYRYSAMSTHGHFVMAGVGPWLLYDDSFLFRYSPAFLLGKQDGTAIGFRHGLSLSLLELVGLEIAHTYVVDDARHHEIGVHVVTDLLFGISLIAASAHGRPLHVGGDAVVAKLARRSDWSRCRVERDPPSPRSA